VHPSLEQLHHLQELERQAAAHRAAIDAVDQRRLEIEAPVIAARQALDALLQTIDERQTQRRAGDRDVANAQQRLTKFRQQLMAVTNGREYEAVQHEIATVEGELKVREDQTISLLFELDELTPQADEARRLLAEREDAAGVSLAGLADETQRHRLELAAIEGSIAALRPKVEASALALYDRAAKRYPLHAIADLKGELCVGCNVKNRHMITSEVRRGEKLVQCENCTRLLYPVKPAAPAVQAAPQL
jgi:predicted  nucleic acid-binding Zn-ribbon protein